MGTNRVNNPFAELPKTIATDLAFYLKYINVDVFDTVLMQALQNYNAPRSSIIWFPIYLYSRQRGKKILATRAEYKSTLDTKTASETPEDEADSDLEVENSNQDLSQIPQVSKHKIVSEFVKKIFNEGTWEEGSFNTLFMDLLIQQLDGYGPEVNKEIARYGIERKKLYTEIKNNLFVMIDAVENITARDRMEESKQKLEELQLTLEQQTKQLAEIETKITSKKDVEKAVDIDIQKKKEAIQAELLKIEKEKQQALADMNEARTILENTATMTDETREAVKKVMMVAAMDYLAELDKADKKKNEIASLCGESAKDREKFKKEIEGKIFELKRAEQVADILRLNKDSKHKQQTDSNKEELAKLLESKKDKFKRLSDIYAKGSHETIPDQASWQKALAGLKGSPLLDREKRAELKAKRAAFQSSHKHIADMLQAPKPNQAKKTKLSKTVTNEPGELAPAAVPPKSSKPMTMMEVVGTDGVVMKIPLPPPPPPSLPHLRNQSALLFAAAKAESAPCAAQLNLQQDEGKRVAVTMGT